MLNTEPQSEGSSEDQSVDWSSAAESEAGFALGPDIPALATGGRGKKMTWLANGLERLRTGESS